MHGVGGEGGALVFAYTVNSLGSRVTYLNGMAPLPTLHMYVELITHIISLYICIHVCMYIHTYVKTVENLPPHLSSNSKDPRNGLWYKR